MTKRTLVDSASLPAIALCAGILLVGECICAEQRIWTDNSDKFSVEAELVVFTDGVVSLRRSNDDKLVVIPFERFSDLDRKYLESSSGPPAQTVPFETEAKLVASDVVDDDNFGVSFAISGNVAIIGAPDAQGIRGRKNAGKAYLFDVTTGKQLFKLEASDQKRNRRFASGVAISGKTAIVTGIITAYIFDVNTGKELRKFIVPEDVPRSAYYGPLAISGNKFIVGNGTPSRSNSGAAYIFDVTTGELLYELKASDGSVQDGFGLSVAISGNYAIVGAPFDDVNNDDYVSSTFDGSAYVFDLLTGKQLFKLVASDVTPLDKFGISVAISGSKAIVGRKYNSRRTPNHGAAYVFDVTTGKQLCKLIASDAKNKDYFGESVAISGNRVIVGALGDDDAGHVSGSAYVFDVTTCKQLFKFTASDAAKNRMFGHAVAISANRVVVRAGSGGSSKGFGFSTTVYGFSP